MADDGMMSYFAKIGLDTSDFLGGITKADSGVLQFYRDVSVSMAATMVVFDKVMAYGQQFVDLANEASEFVSTLDKLSVTTGMSNEELQRFDNVARFADSDINTLAMSVNKMQMNLTDMGAAGDEARGYLDDMGVSYLNADGSLRSSAELFPDIIQGLKGLESSSDRVTAANAIFGRSYQSLAGYIDMGSDAMKDHYNEVNPMTEDQTQSLRDYEEATKDLAASQAELAKTAGAELAPAMTEIAQSLNDLAGNEAIVGFFGWLNGALTLVARGFHIMASEIEFMMILATKGVDAANKHDAELEDWIQKKSRDDAMRAAGYRTDGMGNVVIDEEKAAAGSRLTYDTAEEERLKALKKATDDLTKANEDLFDAKEKLYDINKNYYDDVEYAGRDMSQIRSLTRNRDKDTANQEKEIETAQGKVMAAAGTVANQTGKDLILYIGGNSAPVTVPGVIGNTSGVSNADLMQSGIRKVSN